MSNWNPKPLRPEATDQLFPLVEGEPVIKHMNPMQQQRTQDGSQYTRHGVSSLVPPGPKLRLDDFDKINKAQEEEVVEEEELDVDEVVKAFLGRNV